MPFQLETHEFKLNDEYPTKTQTKYGRPNPRDVYIRYRRIDLKDHLKKIHSIQTKANEVKTKIPDPKPLTKANKKIIRPVV